MSKLSVALGAWRVVKRHRALILKVAAVGGVLVAAYSFVHAQGYEKAEKHYLRQIQLVEEANARAVDKADKAYADHIRQLNIHNKELEDALAKNAEERAADPRGAEPGLGIDGVRRLNRIR
jgi:hypothetical protein